MKKYNRLIAASILSYLFIALAAGYGVLCTSAGSEKMHKVEINRILYSLSNGTSLDELDLRSCHYIIGVSYLPVFRINGDEKSKDFFQERNQEKIELRPLFAAGELKGIFRFAYREPENDTGFLFLLTQGCLGSMELFLIGFLLYLKYRLIRPFLRMSEIPCALAKGHLKGIVKEEKNRFFGRFLWGLGQLSDTLDMTRRREMELEREKKKMLLSLSHDIKTPLNTIKLYARALEENLYDFNFSKQNHRETAEEKKRHAARQIREKSAEIERYVEEIMNHSREDILNIQVKKDEFYLSELMKSVLDVYREKCSLRLLDLKVGPYENRLLKGDLERTIEVFENLFENAFKYGDGRRIAVTFYEEDYCQLVRIYNTGIPVSENEYNHIFESFYRASNSMGIQGNGLGLYICREIMQKMDGEIFAQLEEDGMSFVLVFR